MRVYGLQKADIQTVMDKMGIIPAQSFDQTSRNCVQISLRAETSDSVYARRSFGSGHRSVSLCWHGFRDFIRGVFQLGATRAVTALGRWESEEDFDDGLRELAETNVGSMVYPQYLGEGECKCAGGLY